MFPESKVIPKLLTSLVGEIEFSTNWVGNFFVRDSLACLLSMRVNSVFSGLSFSLTTIHFLNASKILSELTNTGIEVPGVECIFGCHQHKDDG